MERQINQIALSISDPDQSRAWYAALGLEATGGLGPTGGSGFAAMMRMPAVEGRLEWLVGRNPMTQLELFHFTTPPPRPLDIARTARNEGYGSISIFVPDFERHLERLSVGGSSEVTGASASRSLWVKDPDHIPVELMEQDILSSEPLQSDGSSLAGLRVVSLTVSDIQGAEQFWSSAMGFSSIPPKALRSNPLPSWWSDGAAWQDRWLKGGSILVRLLSPTTGGVIHRRPDHGLSDIGVLNIAVIVEDAASHSNYIEILRINGFDLATPEPLSSGPQSALLYGYDPFGNSVETGYMHPGLETQWGWRR